jgi:hypothetical protein
MVFGAPDSQMTADVMLVAKSWTSMTLGSLGHQTFKG